MTQQLLPESPEKTPQHVGRHKSQSDFAHSFQDGLHPIHQLQRTLGNRAVRRLMQAKLAVSHPRDSYERAANRVAEQGTRMPAPDSTTTAQRQDGLHALPQLQQLLGNQRVAQLMRARRLTPHSNGRGRQRKPTVGDAASLVVQRDNREQDDTSATEFAKRARVAVQIMIGVLRTRQTSRPALENLSVELRAEQKEWIVQLWSAATGQSGGASRLTMPERHEALASAMRGALPLADRYALEVPSDGKTMRVELRDALQTLRTELYAAESQPTAGGPFGFVPKIVDMGREPKQARKGAPLSDQPAELREVVYLSFPSRATPKEPEMVQ